MKKNLVLILAAVMLTSTFSACSSGERSAETGSDISKSDAPNESTADLTSGNSTPDDNSTDSAAESGTPDDNAADFTIEDGCPCRI